MGWFIGIGSELGEWLVRVASILLLGLHTPARAIVFALEFPSMGIFIPLFDFQGMEF